MKLFKRILNQIFWNIMELWLAQDRQVC